MYSLSKVRDAIRAFKIKKIIESGESDMLDNKIDKKALEECLQASEEQAETNVKVDLEKTLEDIDEKKLYESIINLKDKKSYVE